MVRIQESQVKSEIDHNYTDVEDQALPETMPKE
jgi:hypothetical protein